MQYIKKSSATAAVSDAQITQSVQSMLEHIEQHGEEAVIEYAQKLDNWSGDFILSDQKRAELIAQVPEQTKQDIQFAYRQVTEFARAQLASLTEFKMTTESGAVLGQKVIPLNCAGCYVPGGRYSHAASAIMSIATAKVAGVQKIIACSPPKNGSIHPAIVYAMDLAGADIILEMGGVQAVASMAKGLFTGVKADILVGPGNGYVAQAKRLLFGDVGIDVFAGPTESAIIADHSADPMTIAVDLVSQAEHGTDSPVWLFTTDRALGEKVAQVLPKVAADMPNHDIVAAAWRDHGEIIFCESREELVQVSDQYASEHLQVITEDTQWWLDNLKNYGSLFLGEGATVTHGDKCSGTNHILPTKQVARYSGGLNVHKFLKILTYQEISEEANLAYSAVGSRVSRVEGMEGHARACDWRLRKYFPEMQWDFEVYQQKRYD
ncbi:MAG: histidinol dehydrogenase [Osedax symbiont Rs2]|nr:MAG: histidinol dehydrogenase [Osedax symbiont Rs2]